MKYYSDINYYQNGGIHKCRPCDNYSVICDPGCTATRGADHGNVCNDSYSGPNVSSKDFYNNQCLKFLNLLLKR